MLVENAAQCGGMEPARMLVERFHTASARCCPSIGTRADFDLAAYQMHQSAALFAAAARLAISIDMPESSSPTIM